jgi:hypothetical protein
LIIEAHGPLVVCFFAVPRASFPFESVEYAFLLLTRIKLVKCDKVGYAKFERHDSGQLLIVMVSDFCRRLCQLVSAQPPESAALGLGPWIKGNGGEKRYTKLEQVRRLSQSHELESKGMGLTARHISKSELRSFDLGAPQPQQGAAESMPSRANQ